MTTEPKPDALPSMKQVTDTPDRTVLENPIWHALTGKHEAFAVGNALARRYPQEFGPFAGLKEFTPDAMKALHSILEAESTVYLTSEAPLSAALLDECTAMGLDVKPLFAVKQMLDQQAPEDLPSEPPQHSTDVILELESKDLPDMLALVAQTKPGPFGRRTPEMGAYFGLREGGQLIAMAGERSKPGTFVEISAVCVLESHRGKGLAGQLMNHLRRRIVEHGGQPYLHVRAEANKTIALYERMGFVPLRTFNVYGASRR